MYYPKFVSPFGLVSVRAVYKFGRGAGLDPLFIHFHLAIRAISLSCFDKKAKGKRN